MKKGQIPKLVAGLLLVSTAVGILVGTMVYIEVKREREHFEDNEAHYPSVNRDTTTTVRATLESLPVPGEEFEGQQNVSEPHKIKKRELGLDLDTLRFGPTYFRDHYLYPYWEQVKDFFGLDDE